MPNGAFDGLSRLAHLDLSFNDISVVGPDAFSATTRRQLRYLDLSSNKFRCDCQCLWFQAWYLNAKEIFPGYDDEYACDNLEGLSLSSFALAPQACLLSRAANVAIVTSLTMVLAALTAAAAVFRCRWQLRLLLYEAFRYDHGSTNKDI